MIDNVRHRRRTTWLLAETIGVAILFSVIAMRSDREAWEVIAVAIVMGVWLDRFYIVAHEGVHNKLLPARPWLNDLAAQVLLLPLAVPLTIYRKIHLFHHGSNRKDPTTAALDGFVVRGSVTPLRRIWYRSVWFFYVFMGGFFIHSLITILLFLVVPTATLKRIDPVFNGWRAELRIRAWGEFLSGLAFHATVLAVAGTDVWMILLGWPIIAFAWVWSLLLYIYHYDTTIGADVRHNVRSLHGGAVTRWIFLNFNEHATHHFDPTIPWYLLPERRHRLPEQFEQNNNVRSIVGAILQQLGGPRFVHKDMLDKGESR